MPSRKEVWPASSLDPAHVSCPLPVFWLTSYWHLWGWNQISYLNGTIIRCLPSSPAQCFQLFHRLIRWFLWKSLDIIHPMISLGSGNASPLASSSTLHSAVQDARIQEVFFLKLYMDYSHDSHTSIGKDRHSFLCIRRRVSVLSLQACCHTCWLFDISSMSQNLLDIPQTPGTCEVFWAHHSPLPLGMARLTQKESNSMQKYLFLDFFGSPS